DDVPLPDAGLLGGSAWRNLRNDGAFCGRQVEPGSEILVDGLDHDAEPAALHLSVFLQLPDDVRGHVGRNGEADADAAAARGEYGRVDADHAPVRIERRTAGVAAIDRRADLQKVVVGPRTDAAAACGDDTGRYRLAEPEGVAYGDDPVPHSGGIRITPLHIRQRFVRIDLHQSEIRLGIRADELRLVFLPALQRHGDLVGIFRHVIVGDDVAFWIDDEARADAADPPFRHLFRHSEKVLEALVSEEALEELRHVVREAWAAHRQTADLLLDLDADDCGRDFRVDVRGAAAQSICLSGGRRIDRVGGLQGRGADEGRCPCIYR